MRCLLLSLMAAATARPVAVVTGANTGIGLETAGQLSQQGFQVILACRDLEKGRQALQKVEHGELRRR